LARKQPRVAGLQPFFDLLSKPGVFQRMIQTVIGNQLIDILLRRNAFLRRALFREFQGSLRDGNGCSVAHGRSLAHQCAASQLVAARASTVRGTESWTAGSDAFSITDLATVCVFS